MINEIMNKQREFFNTNVTKDVKYRIDILKKLQKVIKKEQNTISAALNKDLSKAPFESYETEIGIVLEEIRYTIKHLPKWAKVKKAKSPLMHFPSKSYKYHDPYGIVLIMSPWNYPFQLTMVPLIGAIAGGNTCVVKPSQYSEATSKVIENIIKQVFEENYVAVVQGGREANTSLLEQKFDYIFFTGSPNVGHVVMEAASKNLTPMTLELGGKSPCIVDNTAKIKLAAKRIVWGKYLNGGQTCVAPDYVLVQEDVKEELIKYMKYYISKFYTENPLKISYFPKIITERHFERLVSLIKYEHNVHGGYCDNKLNKIAPTILDQVTWQSPIMQEEIFGPIIPVLSFKTYDDIISILKEKEKPLALYLFTTNKQNEKIVLNNISFGGGCINDTIIHISNSYLQFGGVGSSGMGQYHGKASFDTFTHTKSIMKKSNLIDINLRYPPFKNKIKLLKKIMH